MGFVIHKYLGKSLKAPAPSAKKTANDGMKLSHKKKQARRGSQLSVQSALGGEESRSRRTTGSLEGMDLEIPDSAYAKGSAHISPSNNNPTDFLTPPAPRRKSTGRNTTGKLDMYGYGGRRSSLQHTGASHASIEGAPIMKQKSFRRSSLQNDSMYGPGGRGDDDEQHGGPTNDYYLSEDDDFEAFQRDLMFSSGEEQAADAGFETTFVQENRWLKLELRKHKRQFSRLERKLYTMRDQLAYTNASWIDQLHSAQNKHQEEVFQSQRQAEKAANAILEQELEQWKATLSQVVEASQEKQDLANQYGSPKKGDDASAAALQQELQEWKDRHSQSVENTRQIQNILEQESKEKDALLEEAQRRSEWLEAELQMNKLDIEAPADTDTNSGTTTRSPHHQVAVLQDQRKQLENRLQEILLENAQLQNDNSQTYDLQRRVHDLEKSLEQAREEADLQDQVRQRQIHSWKEQSASYHDQIEALKARLNRQRVSRETIQAEYAHRLETSELENHALKEQLRKKETQFNHQLNMKQNTIGHLRGEISSLRSAAPGLLVGSQRNNNFSSSDASIASFGDQPPSIYRKDTSNIISNLTPVRTSSALPDMTAATDDTIVDGISCSSTVKSITLQENSSPTQQHKTLTSKDSSPAGVVQTPSRKASSNQLNSSLESELQLAKQREKELLMQITSLTGKESRAQNQLQEALHRMEVLESYLKQQQQEQQEDQHRGAAAPKREPETEMRSPNKEVWPEPSFDIVLQPRASKSSPVQQPTLSGEELVEKASNGSSLSQNLYERLEQERQRLKERRSRFLS